MQLLKKVKYIKNSMRLLKTQIDWCNSVKFKM